MRKEAIKIYILVFCQNNKPVIARKLLWILALVEEPGKEVSNFQIFQLSNLPTFQPFDITTFQLCNFKTQQTVCITLPFWKFAAFHLYSDYSLMKFCKYAFLKVLNIAGDICTIFWQIKLSRTFLQLLRTRTEKSAGKFDLSTIIQILVVVIFFPSKLWKNWLFGFRGKEILERTILWWFIIFRAFL